MGSISRYLSCLFLGLYIGYSIDFALLWSLADLFEGLIPLLAFRYVKVEPNYRLKKPIITYGLTGVLVATFIVSAIALTQSWTEVFLATFFVGIAIMVLQTLMGDKKTWGMWIIFGVLVQALFRDSLGWA